MSDCDTCQNTAVVCSSHGMLHLVPKYPCYIVDYPSLAKLQRLTCTLLLVFAGDLLGQQIQHRCTRPLPTCIITVTITTITSGHDPPSAALTNIGSCSVVTVSVSIESCAGSPACLVLTAQAQAVWGQQQALHHLARPL